MVVVHGEVAAKVRSAKFLAVTQDRRVCLTQASLTFALRHVPEGENVGDALRATKVRGDNRRNHQQIRNFEVLSEFQFFPMQDLQILLHYIDTHLLYSIIVFTIEFGLY